MRQTTHHIGIETGGKGLYTITGEVRAWVTQSGIGTGLLTLFLQHTSASVLFHSKRHFQSP